MTYSNDYDDYPDDDADDRYAETGYGDKNNYAWRALPDSQHPPITQQALDWGISGSILAILVLTALYAFSPVDFIPDVIPLAGQADDIAAILAGGGSVAFLTIMRYVLRTRIGRWGCMIAIVLTAIGAFTVFWVLMRVFNSIF